MPTSISDRREKIRARAAGLGFDAVRFAAARPPAGSAEALGAYLEKNYHGTMDWMARHASERGNPRLLWPDARSMILLGVNYGPREDPLAVLRERGAGAISVYARGEDYHDVVKRKLKELAGFVAGEFGAGVKVFVDTAPVMEKPLAQAAGIGWQGKHTNLVSRDFGSWLFLGSVFTTLDLEPDAPESDHCGQCRKCLDACPTNAFPRPYEIDARRCISYLTIEHKGPIPRGLRAALGNRIYGCDDCLAVCPWNKFAQEAAEMKLRARAELGRPRLAELAALDDAAFRALFRKSPVKRIGRARFVRNVLIAIGNSGDPVLASAARALLTDPSALVRGAAAWALSRLLPEADFAVLAASHEPNEEDADVRREWRESATSAAPA